MSVTPTPSPATPPIPPLDRMRRQMRWLRWGLKVVIGLWSVLLLLWLTLHWGFLPRIDQWREDIERQASQAIGTTVRIGRIEAHSSRWIPAIELLDVRLLDAQGREALRLPKVSATFSPRTLLVFEPRFAQLHLEGPQLVVRRDAQGRLHVGGMDMGAASVDGSDGADWFFRQQEFVIEHGRLQWIDEQAGTAPLLLQDVQAVVRNGLLQHNFRLDATPPPEWGGRLSLRGRMTQAWNARAGDWQHWRGRLYAEWPQVNAAVVHAWAGTLWQSPVQLRRGEGGLRAWVDLDPGQWRQATLDLALADLDLQLGADLPALALRRLDARLGLTRREGGGGLQAEQLAFDTADGLRWPRSQLSLAWRQPVTSPSFWPQAETMSGGQFEADRLDLGLLTALAERLPLPASVRQSLAALDPRGEIADLQGQWSGSPDHPQTYQVKARGRDLALAAGTAPEPATPGRPGWRGADLSLQASESGGQAQLSIRDGALVLPGVFADPVVPLAQFDGRLSWQIRPGQGPVAPGAAPPPAVDVQLQDARFANADAQGELQLRWQSGPGPQASWGAGQRYPGRLTLNGKLSRGRATAVARYLPLSLGDSVRQYVQTAVRAGQVTGATFQVDGDLWDFPYARQPQGQFQIVAQVDGVTLDYAPAEPGQAATWPAFEQVRGELRFERDSMSIRQARGKLWGIELRDVSGRIAHFDPAPELHIDGAGRGPLTDALRFMAASPVGGWTQNALAQASASGEADLTLALRIPLDHVERSTVKGRVVVDGNEVRLRPDVPLLSQAKAIVDFSEQGFTLRNGSAQALGGALRIAGGTTADGAVRLSAVGELSAEALRQARELGSVATLAQVMSGQTPYQLQLGFLRGQTEITLDSPLTGMALQLPAPLRKSASESWPLHLQSRLDAGGDPATQDKVQLTLGTLVQGEFQRQLGGATPVLARGALGVGTTPPALPAQGLAVAVRAATLDVDAWQAAGAVLGGSADGGGVGGGDSWVPRSAHVQAQSLRWGDHGLSDLDATVERGAAAAAGERWSVRFAAEQGQGQLEWQPPASANAPGRLQARLARWTLPPLNAPATSSVKAALAKPETRPALPALDIVINELALPGRPLGRLELSSPGAAANATDWTLTKFLLTRPEARLSLSGHWHAAPPAQTQLDVDLELHDSGALLEQFGLAQVLRKGKGRIKGQLAWGGSPMEPRLSVMDGRLRLELGEGQILKADPGGAGRLLGIMTLQSLPRRLLLDFRDVYQEGFSFDTIDGDVALDHGQAHTNNLRIRGVQAAVLIEGDADLVKETQRLHMVVVPEINAGSAALAYATINPAVGLGTFLAQFLLSKPLQQAGTRELRVSGTWDQPVVEVIEPPPGAASAPGPAASSATR